MRQLRRTRAHKTTVPTACEARARRGLRRRHRVFPLSDEGHGGCVLEFFQHNNYFYLCIKSYNQSYSSTVVSPDGRPDRTAGLTDWQTVVSARVVVWFARFCYVAHGLWRVVCCTHDACFCKPDLRVLGQNGLECLESAEVLDFSDFWPYYTLQAKKRKTGLQKHASWVQQTTLQSPCAT